MTEITTPKKDPLWRRQVMKLGKRFLRWTESFLTNHSTVSTTPQMANSEFPWVSHLEHGYDDIRKELDKVLENPEQIPTFHQLSPDQKRISKGNNWKTFAFYVYGQRVDDNCALCPKTAAILDTLPGMQTAMFSILAPRYHIKPHKGPTKAVVRAHLGLKVPKDWENIWIRVDNELLNWKEGEVIVFDDTYEHEVQNNTDEYRAVLFMDIDRPMDRIGTIFNKILISMIRTSTYVKQPIKNLAIWNKEHRN